MSTRENKPKAILVGFQRPGITDADLEDGLGELGRLVQTLGRDPVGILTQRKAKPIPATLIGQGKVEELARMAKELRADEIVFDQELNASQLRNLEEAVGVTIRDRTGVILEIFSQHARTREARVQVDVARLKYLLPRVRDLSGGHRQGLRGASESGAELERRALRDRISGLEEELRSLQENREGRRRLRRNQLSVALVGYTNAGKSSLMRALTGSEVIVADQLFATLDATVRAMQPESYPRILITDTVGFINHLPHDLVASFRSTLEEAANASLLLHVIDASEPRFEQHMAVTREVLGEVGAEDLPSIQVFNKIDRIDEAQRQELAKRFPDALFVSAYDSGDIAGLRRALLEHFAKDMPEATLTVPYDKEGVIGEIRRNALVVDEAYEENGVVIHLKTIPASLQRLKSLLAA